MIINLHSFNSYNLYLHHFELTVSCSFLMIIFHTGKRWLQLLHGVFACYLPPPRGRMGPDLPLRSVLCYVLFPHPCFGYFSVLLTKFQIWGWSTHLLWPQKKGLGRGGPPMERRDAWSSQDPLAGWQRQ